MRGKEGLGVHRVVSGPATRRRIKGFTLVELVMVMIIGGVLAVAVIPRFFDRTTFESRGFYDETLAALRYAQKAAIAQRRTVCVSFAANSVTLTVVTTAGSNDCSGASNLTSPTGAQPFTVQGKNGAAFTATPASFKFTAYGQPLDAANLALPAGGKVIGVSGAPNITVERETGYVH
jgi:MSHA pilin protein MshC